MAGIAPQPQDDQAQPATQQAPDQQQQPEGQPQQGPDEVGDEEGLSPNVSPEEQKQYEDFVLSGLAMIYDTLARREAGAGSPGHPQAAR
jgi:hypothetical protein